MLVVDYLLDKLNVKKLLRDLSERKKEKERIQQEKEELEEKLRLKNKFLEYLETDIYKNTKNFSNKDIASIYTDLKALYNKLKDKEQQLKTKVEIILKYEDVENNKTNKVSAQLVFLVRLENNDKYTKKILLNEKDISNATIREILATLSTKPDSDKIINDKYTYDIDTYLWFFLYVMDYLNENVDLGNFISLLKFIKTTEHLDDILNTKKIVYEK